MKKLIMRIVAVISVFTIITATVLPAYAADDDMIDFINSDGDIVYSISADEFVLDDYCISYQDYLDFYARPFDRPMTFSVGTDFDIVVEAERIINEYANGLAVNESAAAAGKTLSAPELMLAYLLGGGMIVYGVDGIIQTMINDVPEVWNDFISNIYLKSSDETRAWLEQTFHLYVDGRLITVPVSVSEDIARVLNGDVFIDYEGNTVDTSISIDVNIIGGAFPELLPSSVPFNNTDNTKPLLIHFSDLRPSESYSIGGLTISSVYEGSTSNHDNRITFTNNKTGVTLTIPWDQFNYGRGQMARLSKFYKYFDGEKSFWTLYGQYTYGNSSAAYTPEKHTKYANNYVKFENTGTVLDGKNIGGVVWDEVASSWRWVEGSCNSSTVITDDNSFLFNATPFDILLSNTGLETAPAPQFYPLKEDYDAPLTYNPIVPSTTDEKVGIPLNNNYFNDLVNNPPEPNKDVEGSPSFNIPNGGTPDNDLSEKGEEIKDFLSNIPKYFKGLYGWLPDEFENKIDNIFIGLSVLIVGMVVVKIIDIVWP